MRVLSGIQPSGSLHLGNYFGMMKTMIEHQEQHELFCFIANYHAQTSLSDGKALYEACPSTDKTLVQIPGAGHNDIFLRDLNRYMQAIRNLADKVE